MRTNLAPSAALTDCNRYLSLVCLMGKGSKADMRPLVDYNAMILQEALLKIFGKS